MSPRVIRPMLAETAPAPFDSAAHWFEIKWDGFRAILFWERGKPPRLQSRNLHDLTAGFPELGRSRREIDAHDAVLDGELVVLRNGRPDFHALLGRTGTSAPGKGARTPATYIAFDLLYLDGISLLDLPYTERREGLDRVLAPSDRIARSTAVEGSGKALFDASRERGLEGVVAKRAESRYRPGKRSRDWLKVKSAHTLDAVIGGYAVRDGHLASLVLGAYPHPSPTAAGETRRLEPLGRVGSGMSEAARAALFEALEALRTERSPFTDDALPGHPSPFSSRRPGRVFWVKPILVCRVEALERTPEGSLRHGVFHGLRSDKDPEECLVPRGWNADLSPV